MRSFNLSTLLCALVLLVSCYSAYGQSFGKVFSTPQQRAYLDQQREEALAELDEQERLAVLSQPRIAQVDLEVTPRLVHLGGVVRKSNGAHTVWLNGVAVSSFDLPANVVLEFQRGLGVLRIRTAIGEYIVRPGQTLNADNGDVREDYELTPEQAAEVRAEVAQRNAPMQIAGISTSASSAVSTDTATLDTDAQAAEAAEMMANILEMLRLMQEAQDIQGNVR